MNAVMETPALILVIRFAQPLPPAMGAIYKGKVVMLINEDAISQSEHTCLFF